VRTINHGRRTKFKTQSVVVGLSRYLSRFGTGQTSPDTLTFDLLRPSRTRPRMMDGEHYPAFGFRGRANFTFSRYFRGCFEIGSTRPDTAVIAFITSE
jgi:hypothetical protein